MLYSPKFYMHQLLQSFLTLFFSIAIRKILLFNFIILKVEQRCPPTRSPCYDSNAHAQIEVYLHDHY